MTAAMGITVSRQTISYALIADGEASHFGSVHRRNAVGFDKLYDKRMAEVLAIAREFEAAVFVDMPFAPRDPEAWRDFLARTEAVGEIGVYARAAGVRFYRADTVRWSEALFRSRLGIKMHERSVRAAAAKFVAAELTDLECAAVCVGEYGRRYLSGELSGSLCAAGA